MLVDVINICMKWNGDVFFVLLWIDNIFIIIWNILIVYLSIFIFFYFYVYNVIIKKKLVVYYV